MPRHKSKPIKFRNLSIGDAFKFVDNDSKIFIKVSANRYKISKGRGVKYLMKNKADLVVREKGVIQLTDTVMSDWRKNGILLRNLQQRIHNPTG
jgi:hypothetical protein